jgi:hypothetical protein
VVNNPLASPFLKGELSHSLLISPSGRGRESQLSIYKFGLICYDFNRDDGKLK